MLLDKLRHDSRGLAGLAEELVLPAPTNEVGKQHALRTVADQPRHEP